MRTRKSGPPEWQNWPITMLATDARPTAHELEGRPNILELRDAERAGCPIDDTPDPRKARACALRRDIARAELVRRYREAKRAHALDRFDPSARLDVEDLIRANAGKLPKLTFPTLGRPRELDKMLRVYLAVLEEIDRLGGPKHGNISKAIAIVADRHEPHFGLKRVTEIHYRKDPKWLEAVELEIDWREGWKQLADQPFFEPPMIEGQETSSEQFKEYSSLAAADYPNGMPTVEASMELWSWVRRASFPDPRHAWDSDFGLVRIGVVPN